MSHSADKVSVGKTGYNIELALEKEKNKTVLLAKYRGAKPYVTDTAKTDANGKTAFTGDKPLAPGMYLIVTEKIPLFDFLISDTVNQTFGISTVKNKYGKTVTFSGSPENEDFADYSDFLLKRQEREKALKTQAKDSEAKERTDAELASLIAQTEAKVRNIRAKYPGSLLESLATAMLQVHPKSSEIPENNRQQYMYEFYTKHYWDNISLTDERMLDTPLLIPAIDNYFTSILLPIPDTIIRGVDFVLTKAQNNAVVLKYLAGHILDRYLESQIMGMENVIIHIIDNYYLSGKIKIDDGKLREFAEYARKNRPSLVGKQAKDLRMQTVGGGVESLYDIDAPYTLVYIFDVSCGHCRQETPKIYRIFRDFRSKGLAGFCVYSRNDRSEWLEYLTKNELTDWINVWDPNNETDFRTAYSVYSVPQVYLLDKNKKIIGRGLDSISLSRMLNNLLK
jgi:hypothetical protein